MVYTFAMPKPKVAKLFKNGRSQAVRLPKEFRFTGDRVRIRKVAEGVLLEPMKLDPEEWLTGWKRFGPANIFPHGRKQKKPPIRRYFD